MGRAVGRAARRAAFTPNIPPMLLRANQLLAAGDYPAAAEAFEQLARGAEARGFPQAAQLYLQAGRARILAGQTAAGVDSIKRGLALFAQNGQWGRLHQAGNRAVAELNQRGLTKEAQEIAAYIKSALPAGFTPGAGIGPAKPPVLPTHCPGCGAPIRADEVEWLDEVTAECSYCGSPVRGE